MEFATQTAERPTSFSKFKFDEPDKAALERLNHLLDLNYQIKREKSLYRSEKEKLEAEMMLKPLDTRTSLSYFGLLLGIFPPAAIFLKFISQSGFNDETIWIAGIWLIINTITAIVGFFTGRLIGKMIKQAETYPWWAMIFLSPFIGIIWGILAGGAGGVIVFLVGGIFGAFFGALVGAAAMPLFVILHRLLKKGEFIETNQFIPIAVGITLTICSFIFGLPR